MRHLFPVAVDSGGRCMKPSPILIACVCAALLVGTALTSGCSDAADDAQVPQGSSPQGPPVGHWERLEGVSETAPVDMGVSSLGMCALHPRPDDPESPPSEITCRMEGEEQWQTHEISASRYFLKIISDGRRLYLNVERYQESPNFLVDELWRLRPEGEIQRVWANDREPDHLVTAFFHDGHRYALMGWRGLLRLGAEGISAEEWSTRLQPDRYKHYVDATVAADRFWVIYHNWRKDNFPILRLVDSQWYAATDGLPEEFPSNSTRNVPVEFAHSGDALYTLVLTSGPHSTFEEAEDGQVFVWNSENERWQQTQTPRPDELRGDFVRTIHPAPGGIFAATSHEVYHYGAATQEWTNISRGLEAPIEPRSLAAYEDQLYVGVIGQGIWEYVRDDKDR